MAVSIKTIMLARKAHQLRRTLGTRCAAGFLRNRDVPLAEALFIIVGRVS